MVEQYGNMDVCKKRKEIHVVMNQVQSYMKTPTCYNTQWDKFLHLEYINKRYERVFKCHFFVH